MKSVALVTLALIAFAAKSILNRLALTDEELRMHELRLGQKGRETLPKAIRDQYRLSKGDQVRMVDPGKGIMEVICCSTPATCHRLWSDQARALQPKP